MTIIRFPDEESEQRGLEYLKGRFSFKSWPTGETVMPEAAIEALKKEGIPVSVQGPATYDKIIALRK